MLNQRQTHGRRPHGQARSFGQSNLTQPKSPANEETLKSSELQIERKNFSFTLKENSRGRFLRIVEDVGGRRDTIIVPSTGLIEFKKHIDEMVKAADEIPPKASA